MKPKVIIVDENDVEIGLADRDEWEDNAIHRASALWLTNSNGEVLLARRALAKKHAPGKWGCAAAGTVEEGETYDSNIIKETEEEIGLVISLDQLTRGPKIFIGSLSGRRFVQWYMGTVDVRAENLKLQEDEVSEARWVPFPEFSAWIKEKPDDFVGAIPPDVIAMLDKESAQV